MSTPTTCSLCHAPLNIGDWPFCDGDPLSHQPPRSRHALTMEPIVVHRRKTEDGQYIYSYPSSSTEPTPAGYERVELTTIDSASRFCQDRDREEMELRRINIQAEQNQWNERAKDRRQMVDQELSRRLGKEHSRIGDLVRRQIDARREKKYQELLHRSTAFHNQALEFDSSNRPDHYDESRKKVSVVVNGSRR